MKKLVKNFTWDDNDGRIVDRWVEHLHGVVHEGVVRLFQVLDLHPKGAPRYNVHRKRAKLSAIITKSLRLRTKLVEKDISNDSLFAIDFPFVFGDHFKLVVQPLGAFLDHDRHLMMHLV